MSTSDDEYTIPLQDQRVFGAGIKRKRVQFVPSTDAASSSAVGASATSRGRSVSELYLSLVLPQPPSETAAAASSVKATEMAIEEQICEICSLPIPPLPSATPHAALLAHQLSLPHSHPPSALPRERKGVQLLRAQGWDPDARMGLGARGEGIRFPIRVKEKDDKLGVGASVPRPKRGDAEISRAVQQAREGKKRELERGKVGKGWLKRRREEERRRGDRLQNMFYQSEEVAKHLRHSV